MLKITRESVVKAVSLGMKPADLVARLTQLASNEVPRERAARSQGMVQLGSPGHAFQADGTSLRRPRYSRSGHGRAQARAERISDTIVAIDHPKLTATEREKLRRQGILVQADSADSESEWLVDNE